MKIGVLALQGSFKEHQETLQRLGIESVQVRDKEQVDSLTHLILPGGESTTIGHLLTSSGLLQAIQKKAQNSKLALYGTCAGAILLAKQIIDEKPGQPRLNLMDITIRRNAFGRQLDSFETKIQFKGIKEEVSAIFIRAPKIESVGPQGEILSQLPDGTIIAAQQGKILVTSFHPELTKNTEIHRYFLTL